MPWVWVFLGRGTVTLIFTHGLPVPFTRRAWHVFEVAGRVEGFILPMGTSSAAGFVTYRSTYLSKSCCQAKPSYSFGPRPGSRILKAKALLGQAKARAFRPSQARTSLTIQHLPLLLLSDQPCYLMQMSRVKCMKVKDFNNLDGAPQFCSNLPCIPFLPLVHGVWCVTPWTPKFISSWGKIGRDRKKLGSKLRSSSPKLPAGESFCDNPAFWEVHSSLWPWWFSSYVQFTNHHDLWLN
jgi:hypothetical protein